MSHVAFTAPSGEVQLTGVELHNIAALAEQALHAALAEPDCADLRPRPGWDNGAPRVLAHPQQRVLVMGRPVYLFDIALHTLAAREPAALALTKTYAGCSSYGWVDGPDRAWLADAYQQALDAGVARPLMGDRHQAPLQVGAWSLPPGNRAGWEELIGFLRERDDEPVVTTLSIDAATFPAEHLAAEAGLWDDDAEPDAETGDTAWERLPDQARWELGIGALRLLEPERRRQWTPAAFARPRLSVYDLAAWAEHITLPDQPRLSV